MNGEEAPQNEDIIFGVIPRVKKNVGNITGIVSNKLSDATSVVTGIPGNIVTYVGNKVSGALDTANEVLKTAEESKAKIKYTIGRVAGLAKLGAEASDAIATPLMTAVINSSPTVIAAKAMGKVAADLAAEAAAKAAGAIPPIPALPTQIPSVATPPKPTHGGSNNQIGGLKRLVNEKKTIVKRIARTMKLFNRTNTRKRGRKGKSKRVRFAL